MDPTIKLFRKKFCVRDKLAIDGYALLLLKATVKNLEQFLLSEKQKAHEEGYTEGVRDNARGTKNGVQRYQMGYRDGSRESLNEIEKWAEEKRMKNDPPQMILTGFNLALTDLQHHISKMRDNK